MESENNEKIITHHIYPPIPIRTFDWQAYRDGDEETGPFGYGAFEHEAVEDLRQQLREQEACASPSIPAAPVAQPKQVIWTCIDCGSEDVQMLMLYWVNPNTEEKEEDAPAELYGSRYWCNECQDHPSELLEN